MVRGCQWTADGQGEHASGGSAILKGHLSQVSCVPGGAECQERLELGAAGLRDSWAAWNPAKMTQERPEGSLPVSHVTRGSCQRGLEIVLLTGGAGECRKPRRANATALFVTNLRVQRDASVVYKGTCPPSRNLSGGFGTNLQYLAKSLNGTQRAAEGEGMTPLILG